MGVFNFLKRGGLNQRYKRIQEEMAQKALALSTQQGVDVDSEATKIAKICDIPRKQREFSEYKDTLRAYVLALRDIRLSANVVYTASVKRHANEKNILVLRQ